MNISKKLEQIQAGYASMYTQEYDSRWYKTGERRINDIPIVDDDYIIESFFLLKAENIQKSVRFEDKKIHTRLINMTLYDRETDSYKTYDYEELRDIYNEHTINL